MDGAGAKYFLALWPDASVRQAIAAWRDAWAWNANATPVADQRLHLTLHYLGAQPAPIIAALDSALRAVAPFACTLRFDSAGLWPHGIAVLESASTPPALTQLHASTGLILHALGLQQDLRPYRPHITLARRATNATKPQARPFTWEACGFVLAKSEHGHYTVLQSYGVPNGASME